MRTFQVLCAFVLIILCVGCVSTRYEIEMSAEGDRLKRKVTVKGPADHEKFSALR